MFHLFSSFVPRILCPYLDCNVLASFPIPPMKRPETFRNKWYVQWLELLFIPQSSRTTLMMLYRDRMHIYSFHPDRFGWRKKIPHSTMSLRDSYEMISLIIAHRQRLSLVHILWWTILVLLGWYLSCVFYIRNHLPILVCLVCTESVKTYKVVVVVAAVEHYVN